MWNKIRNERGLLLPDLIASLPLGVIVMVVMTFSVINFTLAYSDVKEFTQMQDDLFQAVETLRYGYVQSGVNTNGAALCGLMTANQVTTGESSITLKVDGNPAQPILSNYWVTGDGKMRLRGSYGSQQFSSPGSSSAEIAIFPKSDRREGGELKYRILNPGSTFSPLKYEFNENTNTNMIRLLGENIEAQVRFRERQNGQSEEDDRRMNTRRVRYQTKIFVPNTPSQV